MKPINILDFFTEEEERYLDLRFAEVCAENKIKKPKMMHVGIFAWGIVEGLNVFLSRYKPKDF